MLHINITPFSTHIQQKQDWVSIARASYKIKTAIRELKKQDDSLVKQLKDLSHNESSKGGGFLFSKITNKGRVLYNTIPVLDGIDLDEYRGSSTESWKLEKK